MMASKQKRRTPRNIYTEKHAEREFQDFIRRSQLNNLPIPEDLIPPSGLARATNDNRLKRQRLALPEVRQIFPFWRLYFISFPY
jgi:hypothetical protein